MPELDELPPSQSGRHQNRATIYPWPTWTDGRPRLIIRNDDYTVGDVTMVGLLRQHARRHDMTVQIRKMKEGIAFQFRAPEDPCAGNHCPDPAAHAEGGHDV